MAWDKHWLQIRLDVAAIAAAISSVITTGKLQVDDSAANLLLGQLTALINGGKLQVDAGISGGTISVAPVRAAGVLHRSAVVAIDKLAVAGTPTNADAGAIAGGNLNGTYYSAVCAGNSFGPSGISAASSSIAIGTGHLCDVTITPVTGAEFYDVFFGDNNTTHLMHVGRVPATNGVITAGATLLTAETPGTAGGNAENTIRIGAVGAGLVAAAVQFSQNIAYKVLTPTAAIDCNGKSYVDVFIQLTVTDLRSAPSLSLMPIFKSGQTPAGYFCGSPISVPILNGSVGQSHRQMYRIDVEDVAELIIAVGTISGQGASVDIWAEAI